MHILQPGQCVDEWMKLYFNVSKIINSLLFSIKYIFFQNMDNFFKGL